VPECCAFPWNGFTTLTLAFLSCPQLLFTARQSVLISMVGIVFPFLLGCGGSVVLYRHRENTEEVPFSSFLLFTGLSLSITAFPILARILTDLNLMETEVGVMTIGAAALGDAVAWCFLILVISILHRWVKAVSLEEKRMCRCPGRVCGAMGRARGFLGTTRRPRKCRVVSMSGGMGGLASFASLGGRTKLRVAGTRLKKYIVLG